MRKLGDNLPDAIRSMGGNTSSARVNMRAHQVRDRFKQVLQQVYGSTAEHFLAHTNNVYIMDKDGERTLIVYVDESIFAADLNAQRELIRLKLMEEFNEDVKRFEIYISRGNYKNNHPYAQDEAQEPSKDLTVIPLDDIELKHVNDTVQAIQDERLRESVKKAMTRDLEWKKSEKPHPSPKNTK